MTQRLFSIKKSESSMSLENRLKKTLFIDQEECGFDTQFRVGGFDIIKNKKNNLEEDISNVKTAKFYKGISKNKGQKPNFNISKLDSVR